MVTLDIPVWTWVVSGLALAAAALVDWFATRRLSPLLWAVAAPRTLTLVASFFAISLTLLVLGVIVVGGRDGRLPGQPVPRSRLLASAVAMGAAGAWVWAYGDCTTTSVRWTAFVALTAVALLALLHAAFTQRGDGAAADLRRARDRSVPHRAGAHPRPASRGRPRRPGRSGSRPT